MIFAQLYLKLLPFFLAFGVILHMYRIVGVFPYFVPIYYGIWQIFDIVLYLLCRPRLTKFTLLIMCLLCASLVVGYISFPFERHTITDFSNPLIFFLKIEVFILIFSKINFEKYAVYFSKVTIIICGICLPLVYYVISHSAFPRMSVYAPLELAFSWCLLSGYWRLLVIVIIQIVLFGQRAMSVSLLGSYLLTLYFQKIKIKIILSIILVLVLGLTYFLVKDTIAFDRLAKTFTMNYMDLDFEQSANQASAGRLNEIVCITNTMQWYDYLLGKGCGARYFFFTGYDTVLSWQSHFSPLSFTMKYGVFFCVLIYGFILLQIYRGIRLYKKSRSNVYACIASIALSMFLFESMFSYLLLSSYAPLLLGYIIHIHKMHVHNEQGHEL